MQHVYVTQRAIKTRREDRILAALAPYERMVDLSKCKDDEPESSRRHKQRVMSRKPFVVPEIHFFSVAPNSKKGDPPGIFHFYEKQRLVRIKLKFG